MVGTHICLFVFWLPGQGLKKTVASVSSNTHGYRRPQTEQGGERPNRPSSSAGVLLEYLQRKLPPVCSCLQCTAVPCLFGTFDNGNYQVYGKYSITSLRLQTKNDCCCCTSDPRTAAGSGGHALLAVHVCYVQELRVPYVARARTKSWSTKQQSRQKNTAVLINACC